MKKLNILRTEDFFKETDAWCKYVCDLRREAEKLNNELKNTIDKKQKIERDVVKSRQKNEWKVKEDIL